VAGTRANGLERPAADLVRDPPAPRRSGRRDPVARRAAQRAGQDPHDLGGMVVGLPSCHHHARAAGGGTSARAAYLPARRPAGRARAEGRPGRVAERRSHERVPPGAGRPDLSVDPGRGLLYKGSRVPVPLHGAPRALPQGPSGPRHASGPAGRDAGAGVGALPARPGALQRSPFFKVWASAAIDEMLSALYEQRVLGVLPDPCRA